MLGIDAVHNEDCLAGLKKLDDGSVDLAFADPPFNIGYDYDVYEDRARARKNISTGAAAGPPRWSACSSPTARSGWPSATNMPPS